MIAYKGFNKDLACTMGHGTFQYQVGQTYKEDKAQCANTGFHCTEEPLEVREWYYNDNSRYCIVIAAGDVHEDGLNKISCTEMTILREITLEQLGILECEWLINHPEREYSDQVEKDTGRAGKNGIVVVRGKNPKASGEIGSTIFLLKEGKGTKEIISAGAYRIDGVIYLPDTYYNAEGRQVKCGRKN